MTDGNCVFCKIVSGALPAHKLLETPHAIAFLDIAPLAEGHTVVIPRQHAVHLHDLSADAAAEVCRPIGGLAARIMRVTGASGYNVLQNNGRDAGQAVFHVHFHIIPRRPGDGLGYRWNPEKVTQEQLASLSRKILA